MPAARRIAAMKSQCNGLNQGELDNARATGTGSAGISYTLNKGSNHPTLSSIDALVQSGLRASTATIPNGTSLPLYGVGNLSIVQRLDTGAGKNTEVRLDVLNLGDAVTRFETEQVSASERRSLGHDARFSPG
jgi:hypothetical protein